MLINKGCIILKYSEYMDQAESCWYLITDYYDSISNFYP